MSAAHGNPLGPIPQPGSKVPRLVRTGETVPQQTPAEAITRADPHPLAAAFIIGVIALTGAVAATILMWIWFRDTGVNWMFQGHDGAIQ